jgi:four helix bundle protein
MRDHKTLLCWQLARDLSEEVHRATVGNWKPPATAAFDQLRRASLSVRLNIAEGHAIGSPGGFARHLTIAYGSAVETAELLEFCRDTAGYLKRQTSEHLFLLQAGYKHWYSDSGDAV